MSDRVQVLELAGGPAAAFAGMLLAARGYDIVRSERPGGGAFQEQSTVTTDSATEAYLMRGKRRAEIDLTTSAGATAFQALVRGADGLIEDLGPGGLERLRLPFGRLHRLNRRLTVARAAPFGLAGRRAGWQASELVIQAMGGIVSSTG
jgi:crotonobetainyl-CoA:carnitine CoA-transferase CaiB-like acyl-CoA transferase